MRQKEWNISVKTQREAMKDGYLGLLHKYAQRVLAGNLPLARQLVKTGIVFTFYDNFTTAVIVDRYGRMISAGAAKRIPKDKKNENVGKVVALWRAYDAYFTRVRP